MRTLSPSLLLLPNALGTSSNQFSPICRVCQGSCCCSTMHTRALCHYKGGSEGSFHCVFLAVFLNTLPAWPHDSLVAKFPPPLLPCPQRSEGQRSTSWRNGVACVKRGTCSTWEHQMTRAPLKNIPNLDGVWFAMFWADCCVTSRCVTQINSTWSNEIMWMAFSLMEW